MTAHLSFFTRLIYLPAILVYVFLACLLGLLGESPIDFLGLFLLLLHRVVLTLAAVFLIVPPLAFPPLAVAIELQQHVDDSL